MSIQQGFRAYCKPCHWSADWTLDQSDAEVEHTRHSLTIEHRMLMSALQEEAEAKWKQARSDNNIPLDVEWLGRFGTSEMREGR